ncbi:SHOCT domain-containing protein [Candidatus Riflebacteria bacterium]
MENYYKILGTDINASLSEIAEAFKARYAQLLKQPPSEKKDESEKLLKIAVTTLGNVQKRNQYDRILAIHLKKEDKLRRKNQVPKLVTKLSVRCDNCPNSTFFENIDYEKEFRCFHCNCILNIPKQIICNMCDEKVNFSGEPVSCPKCTTLLHTDIEVIKNLQLKSTRELEKILKAKPSTVVPKQELNSQKPVQKNGIIKGDIDEIVAALKKLKELVNMEIITQEEFENKKKELMARI